MNKTYTFCCKRCGSIFESTGDPDFCEDCRKIVYDTHKRRIYAVRKQCEVCGTDFIAASNAFRVCPECRAVMNCRRVQQDHKPKKKRTQPDIATAVKLAQAAGLSYGEYMAKYGGRS